MQSRLVVVGQAVEIGKGGHGHLSVTLQQVVKSVCRASRPELGRDAAVRHLKSTVSLRRLSGMPIQSLIVSNFPPLI